MFDNLEKEKYIIVIINAYNYFQRSSNQMDDPVQSKCLNTRSKKNKKE